MKKVAFLILTTLIMAVFPQKAKITLDGGVVLSLKKLSNAEKVEQLPEGAGVPGGYSVVARGNFRTGIATIKCGERFMKKKTIEKCVEIGATAFKYIEVSEPIPFFNSCFRSKILFLIRE